MAEPAPRPCSVEGCSRRRKSRGWCTTHYERWRIHGDPLHETYDRLTACTIAECQRPHRAAGLCSMHYSRVQRGGPVGASQSQVQRYASGLACEVLDCDKPREKRGWCAAHYKRWRVHGDPAVVLNPWNTQGEPCRTCGREILTLGSRMFCSSACARVHHRAARGETTFVSRTDCSACSVFMPVVVVSGFRKRGNGYGLCWPCADQSPCPTCGGARKRSGKVLVCRPCRRPRATADQLVRRARQMDAICVHGDKCVTSAAIAMLRQQPCFYCGDPAEHADHFEPLARDGKHCIENLVPACAPCNLTKSDNDPWAWWARRAAETRTA